MINHAVILAAGRGVRMMPKTKKIPKAMVKIKNQTLILNGIKKIQKYIKNIHITVGYKGSMLAKHVIENKVNSVINTNKKGNAWWIFNFPFNLINEPVFVLTCDNITNINFKLIEKDYIKKGKPECFLVPVKPVKNLEGDFIHKKKNIVLRLSRKEKSDIYCSGIQIVNPYKINKIVNKTEDFNFVWKKLIFKKKLIVSDVTPKKWFTIDSVKQLKIFRKKNIGMYSDTLVAILAYNEQKKISDVLTEVTKKFSNVLVVDNNSEDQTVEEVKKFKIFLIKHKYNFGKSGSMKTALEFAKLKEFKYLAFMDADGQHRTSDLINICKRIREENNQLIIGYRKNLKNLNFKKRIGTIILQKLFFLLYRKKVYDIQSGLRIFDISIENMIYWYSTGINHYFADAEITCNAVRNKCKIEQIPIETFSSEKYKGMNIIQGLYLILMILCWRLFK